MKQTTVDKQEVTKLVPGIDDVTADSVVDRCEALGVSSEQLAKAVKAIARAAHQAAVIVAEFMIDFKEALAKSCDMDLLQAMAENPKLTHLSRYAKKKRTRKKNQHILERKAARIHKKREKKGANS
ncbi:MAG: hypothetical protein IJ680_01365 [Paludibacteraceae bacterium]|nr:hypothetical protein [Eubacterium sp.]MBR1630482.1 hypothetical protein [Paludibacteraceae bacterium]